MSRIDVHQHLVPDFWVPWFVGRHPGDASNDLTGGLRAALLQLLASV